MNGGAFGENFPYTNFHDLNMDWIIKIAKDFLDQYTHIQEIIANGEQSLQDLTTSGLAQLEEKANDLEALLQDWYDTHSQDIANQLADALADLNNWYTEHQGYLDQTLIDNENKLNEYASQKLEDVLASIPSDYSDMSKLVSDIVAEYFNNTLILTGLVLNNTLDISAIPLTQGYFNGSFEWITNNPDLYTTRHPFKVPDNTTIKASTEDQYKVMHLMEFDPITNQRIRNVSGSAIRLDETSRNYVYTLTVGDSQAGGTPPTTGFTCTLHGNGNEFIAIASEEEITTDIIAKGYHLFTDDIESGYYNSTGVWANSNQHYSMRKMFKLPFNTKMIIDSTLSDATIYLKAFRKVGNSYVRIINSGAVNHLEYTTTEEGLYYNIDFFNATGWNSRPAGDFTAVAIYLLNSFKTGQIYYNYVASTKTLTITTPKMRYVIKRIIDASIHIDSWRLYSGEIILNNQYNTLWVNSDAEGPILIDNEPDFISGYHGDEILESATLFIDTGYLDIDNDRSGFCDSITLYQKSICYRANSDTEAFTRFKRVRIMGSNYDVQQRWISKINCTVTRGAFGVLQAYKDNLLGWDTNYLLPRQGLNGSVPLDKRTTIGTFYFPNNSALSINISVGNDNQYYNPELSDMSTQNRLKFYFDMYNGKTLTVGEYIESKFTVRLNQIE